MKKAGTIQITPRDELKPPVWLALSQLLFAAMLLYVMRNPVSIEHITGLVIQEKPLEPAFTITIPLSTVAVAEQPAKEKPAELSM